MNLDADSLARFSDGLLYSAIAVLALALIAHAAATASRAARATAVPATRIRSASSTPTMATVGAGPAAERTVPDLLDPSVASDRDASRTDSLRIEAIATSLTVLGGALVLGAVIARGLAAGRAPWGNMFEFVVVGSLAVLGAYLAVLTKRPVRSAGVWIVALSLLGLGLSMTVLYTPVDDLVPVLDSYWLVIHVAAAIVCGGVFSVGAVTALLYLVRDRWERRGGARVIGRYVGSLPAAPTLEKITHTVHVFVFPLWTFAVIAGAIWAENAWGRYWGWDPKETWAFITWVCYAAYLHAQSTAGWRGRKATWFAVAGYAAFLFNFFGVNLWISGLHSYAGV